MMQREESVSSDTAHQRRRRKTWADEQSVYWYQVTQVLVGLLLRLWIRRFRAIGAENVPTSGGLFLVANHTSALDPFLLGYPVKQRLLGGPGKVGLFRNPVVAYFMRKIGIFPLRQGEADAGAVRTMVQLFRASKAIIVYPEGGRSETGELKPFTPDFARLVIRLRAPVVPAALAGARDVLPIGSLVPRPNKRVVVQYGEPFELSEYYERELTDAVVREANGVLEERVRELLARAREELTAR